MFFCNTKLLHPRATFEAEYCVPETAQLSGICFDYSLYCVVVYDRVEGKLLWLEKDTGVIVRSAVAPVLNNNMVIGMTQFLDVLYALVYLGEGQMTLAIGSLAEGRLNGFVNFNYFNLPFYQKENVNVWDQTHSTPPTYYKYHPKYCGIFNIGYDLYLLAGLSDDVEADAPPNLGQYIIHYDPSGIIIQSYKLDDSSSAGTRLGSLDPQLNGVATGAVYHDGIVTLIVDSYKSGTGVLKHLKFKNPAVLQPALFEIDTRAFFMGPFPVGTSACVAGRKFYAITSNRVIQSEIFMFDIWCNDEGELQSNTIDMGVIAAGQLVSRRVTIQNSSPFYNYKNFIIECRDPNMSVAVDLGTSPGTFQSAIKIPTLIRNGERAHFYLRVQAPALLEQNTPKQYWDKLSIKAEGEW